MAGHLSQNTTVGGIGLVINQYAYKALSNIESINQRTMVAMLPWQCTT